MEIHKHFNQVKILISKNEIEDAINILLERLIDKDKEDPQNSWNEEQIPLVLQKL